MSDTPAYPFCVAVVGRSDAFPDGAIVRLVELLVNRHRADRPIILLTAPGGTPVLPWAHDRGWSVFAHGNESHFKLCCGLIAQADAVLVIGSPDPWRRLLALAHEAGIPTRVYERCPRLPPAPEYPAEG